MNLTIVQVNYSIKRILNCRNDSETGVVLASKLFFFKSIYSGNYSVLPIQVILKVFGKQVHFL